MKKLMLSALVMFVFMISCFAEDSDKTLSMKKEGIQTININDIKEFNKKEMAVKMPFSTDKLIFSSYFLAPRQLLKLCKSSGADEIFYIVEGQGQFTSGNDQIMVKGSSVVLVPAGVSHGIVNSENKELVVISAKSPKPSQIVYVENSSAVCPVCRQEVIVTEGAKEGDIITCPRCHFKLKLLKEKDGKWMAVKL